MIEHTETYQGVQFTVAADHLVYDGRRVRRPTRDTTAVIRKVRAWVRREHADDRLRPELTRLVGVLPETDLHPAQDATTGDAVYVHAMGRWRRGKVTGVGRTHVTVAYTTASSSGRTFRNPVPPAELRRPRTTPTVVPVPDAGPVVPRIVRHCQAQAPWGTCNRPLTKDGTCPLASDHPAL